jgi:hypothetical protein
MPPPPGTSRRFRRAAMPVPCHDCRLFEQRERGGSVLAEVLIDS